MSAEPTVRMLRLLSGGVVGRALYAVCKLRIADALVDGPRSIDELAAICGAEPDALGRYMGLLAGAGVFSQQDAGLGLTEAGHLLRRDAADSMWSSIVLSQEMLEPTPAGAVFALRTGATAFDHSHPSGAAGLCARLAGDPDAEDLFADTCAAGSAYIVDAVRDAIDWADVRHVVDVGGNRGALLTALLTSLPGATGVLFDQPHVLAAAGPPLMASAAADRVDCYPGDLFEAVPPGGDLYVLANVLMRWPTDRASSILRRCHDAMARRARLVIVEPLLDDEGAAAMARVADLMVFWATGGRLRGSDEWRSLLAAGGFSLDSVTPTTTGWSVLAASPRP